MTQRPPGDEKLSGGHRGTVQAVRHVGGCSSTQRRWGR
ncbi:hypothetical protein RR42_m0417 [Cupriavidus basilensis]|uniref:Uncharacterized protein n=1 Tax=Cupriavidus basilensis TaxID=68895 RepID=A0A0C4Y4I2_9BURK|nr:hypothetical protein RR42_m0417 [Cupriavidus basilensis]